MTNRQPSSAREGVTRALKTCGIFMGLAILLAGCVYAPPPEPAPGGYYAPCCYAYPEYPPYYYGPAVGFGFYGGGWHGRWR